MREWRGGGVERERGERACVCGGSAVEGKDSIQQAEGKKDAVTIESP